MEPWERLLCLLEIVVPDLEKPQGAAAPSHLLELEGSTSCSLPASYTVALGVRSFAALHPAFHWVLRGRER